MSHLGELAVGTSGRVNTINGVDDVSMRLLEMGLTPGVEFSLIGTAPLGDPIEIEVRGYRLSLRKAEAARIEVSVD